MLDLILQQSCSLILIMAAVPKFLDRAGWSRAIRAYEIIPAGLVGPLARALPPVELAIAVALLLGWLVDVWAAIGALLMLAFLLAQVSVLVRRLKISCGCFSSAEGEEKVGWWTILRTAVFFSLFVSLSASSATGHLSYYLESNGGDYHPISFVISLEVILLFLACYQAFRNLATLDLRR